MINGPPHWLKSRHGTADDSPPPRPPPMVRSTSTYSPSQQPPSLPPKQPRPLSHHAAPRNDPVNLPSSLLTSYPSPPSQPVATIPRRAVPGPVGFVPAPDRPSRSEAEDNSSNECAVCLERTPDCVLYTCGHMCMCYECAVHLHQRMDATCPICRQPIVDIIKIYRA